MEQKSLSAKEVNKRLKSRGVPGTIVESSWVNARTPFSILCPKHGIYTLPTHGSVGSLLYGFKQYTHGFCPTCRPDASSSISTGRTQSFNRLVQRVRTCHGSKIKLLRASDTLPMRSKADFKCSCGCKWSCMLGNVVRTEKPSGCPDCGCVSRGEKFKTGFAKGRPFKLGERTVSIQGYEDIALNWITSHKGIRPDQIVVAMERGAKRFPYLKDTGRRGTYHPDILIPHLNRIIEVKSTWTVRLRFKDNVAKAIACMDAGYAYTMLVYDGKGNRIRLPTDWYKLQLADIEQIVN